MDLELSDKVLELVARVAPFMNACILPRERHYW